ncbi:hypothetical protein [Secundilactobacillus muriivasis]
MPIYYVKPDSDNKFPDKDTTPALDPADGLRAVNIPTTSIQYFTRYWWMYAFKRDDSQEVTPPGNLPNLDIDYLQGLIDQQGTQLEGAIKTNNDLKKLASDLTLQQAQLNQSVNESKETIKSLQTLAGQLTLTVTQMQVNQTTVAPATGTDTSKADTAGTTDTEKEAE